ncbi:hypothetical protein F3Y22_tig00109924pilonHSYRG00044 [Hibiscus syriacus]|uniref:Uncharacterized protein n=1 Tax=Hibiscus syriacus TaxID=106335 RepID=A0A6A3BY45_HIBSY|nr:hypothetical protein F3Y22_tig00109924pilonHSYRG00044 [Hibiscus syriacus]
MVRAAPSSRFFFEIGPLKFEVVEYNGSLPTLVLNPYSWTKASNIILVDSPVGTSFSYSRNNRDVRTTDFKQVCHLHQFLQKGGGHTATEYKPPDRVFCNV